MTKGTPENPEEELNSESIKDKEPITEQEDEEEFEFDDALLDELEIEKRKTKQLNKF
jgi:hypothetical protein